MHVTGLGDNGPSLRLKTSTGGEICLIPTARRGIALATPANQAGLVVEPSWGRTGNRQFTVDASLAYKTTTEAWQASSKGIGVRVLHGSGLNPFLLRKVQMILAAIGLPDLPRAYPPSFRTSSIRGGQRDG